MIITPIITEKSMQRAGVGKYTFAVTANENKAHIAKQVKEIYRVDATKVNIIKMQPIEKIVRGRTKAKVRSKKYAIVTIKKGQKIDGFEMKE